MKLHPYKQIVALLTDLEADTHPSFLPLPVRTQLSLKAGTLRVVLTPDEASIRRVDRLRMTLSIPVKPHLLLPKPMYRQVLPASLYKRFEALTSDYTDTRPYPGVDAYGLVKDRALFRIQWYAAMRQLCTTSHRILIHNEKNEGYFASAIGLLERAYGSKMETVEAKRIPILPKLKRDEPLVMPLYIGKSKRNKGKAGFQTPFIELSQTMRK